MSKPSSSTDRQILLIRVGIGNQESNANQSAHHHTKVSDEMIAFLHHRLRLALLAGFLSSINAFGVHRIGYRRHFEPPRVFLQPEQQQLNQDEAESEVVSPEELWQELDATFDYEGRIQIPTMIHNSNATHRCGFVSIIGAPNMGKSTLLNALLDHDLCIATHKPQTTRHAILGILSTTATQVCFVDTPGIIDNPAYKLQEGMMEAVVGAFHDADVLLVVTDVFSTPIPSDSLFQRVVRASVNRPVVVVINKVDLSAKINPYDAAISKNKGDEENPLRTFAPEQAVGLWRQLIPNAVAILPASAKNGRDDPGIVALRTILANEGDAPAAVRALGRPIPGMFLDAKTVPKDLLPPSPPLYDTEHLTDKSERWVASEIIRASLLESLRAELPYCCQVEVAAFKEKETLLEIDATIFVERNSQKGIVVGKGGSQIGTIRRTALKQLESFFATKVVLQLTVKVDKDWRKNPARLKEMGYLKQA